MTKPAQDDLPRQRRINQGCCPTHGCELMMGEFILPSDYSYECPRTDCDYAIVPAKDSKGYKALAARRCKRDSGPT